MSDRPLLRVVRGNPDDAELAALTAVVAAAASAAAAASGSAAPARRTSWWNDRSAAVRVPVQAGDGAWRASALPH
ncbi:acyl-CoA carboxylase epsilon subunit [Amycolatopsis rhabdoformis]|uniref:Acyl-CoA carboxylase epsilon subunit n=1 Tax=Amycolatopsis rhabdoformis TaxID=1448059 RepID=A0ABZ1I519_9PSEU|nr:acyl-CoA carboxylase epsilon subunit [Amycolatopsis rhabdoformis]WSE29375.1 acyl-CoA carboxylase epsilon subunit [Amycolatopsis rhabdoformis]